MRSRLLPLAAAFLAFGFAAHAQSAPPGIRLGAMDTAVKPGDNFYLFCNGTWAAQTTIPPDRTSVNGFSLLAERTDTQLTTLLQQVVESHPGPESDAGRIAALYASYLDTGAIAAAGMKPVAPALTAIDAIHDQQSLAVALGRSLRADVDALNRAQFHTPNLFGLWVAPGFRDPHHYAAYLFQGGLTLPSQQDYVDPSPRMATIRQALLQYATTLLESAGTPDAAARAARVVALETALAQTHLSLADSENIRKANNLWTADEFATKAPGLDWPAFFDAAQLGGQREFYVWQPSAVTAEAALVAATPLETWKDFLRVHTLDDRAPYLSPALEAASFELHGKVLYGIPQQRPRDRRARDLVNTTLGDAVGKLYVERYFPASSRQQAQELVAHLLTAYHQRLEGLTWMAPSTKAEALHKLATLRVSVGYPDHFRTYNGLTMRPADLAGNMERADAFEYRYQRDRIGQPTDPGEWSMTPQTVNAVEMPLNNALNFPAAILQPPFFDPAAPAAANYGGIGTVIGHEISHTFDSEGSDFDAEGRVRDWWTATDRAHFEASTAALAAQFDSYEVLPGLHVNGRQTLGEDIADLAGLHAALDAYHAAMQGRTAPKAGAFDGDQQFFIAFGQNWRSKAREAAQRSQLMVDPHAPAPIRADTVRNLDSWYRDFDVKPGEALYLPPEKRVQIF